MKTIKEEIFRTQKGIEIAKYIEKTFSLSHTKLLEFKQNYLNKSELQELVNWLISKLDEME